MTLLLLCQVVSLGLMKSFTNISVRGIHNPVCDHERQAILSWRTVAFGNWFRHENGNASLATVATIGKACAL